MMPRQSKHQQMHVEITPFERIKKNLKPSYAEYQHRHKINELFGWEQGNSLSFYIPTYHLLHVFVIQYNSLVTYLLPNSFYMKKSTLFRKEESNLPMEERTPEKEGEYLFQIHYKA